MVKWLALGTQLWCRRLLVRTSYCSYARPAQPGPIQWLRPLHFDSVIKLVSVLFGNYTILVVMKSWPMETRRPCDHCGSQWKAEKLGAFWHWPITRCFIKSDRAKLIIEHSINFRLDGEYWRTVQSLSGQPSNKWVPFLNQGRIKQKRRGIDSAVQMLCIRYSRLLTPTAHMTTRLQEDFILFITWSDIFWLLE